VPSTRRQALAVVAVALVVAGCSGRPATPAPTVRAAATMSAPATPTASGTRVPLTAAERAWLAAIPTFMDKMETAFSQQNVRLTPMKLRELGNLMRGCRHELARGLPGQRLQPAYALVLRACGEYEKGAACFATAARIGALAAPEPDEDRAYGRAIDCGFTAQGKGFTSLAEASNTGESIKIAAESLR
jgi:hypothetical protein